MLVMTVLVLSIHADPSIQADPAAEQLRLLTTFRHEFVLITPGTGEFPAPFVSLERDGDGDLRLIDGCKGDKPGDVGPAVCAHDLRAQQQ